MSHPHADTLSGVILRYRITRGERLVVSYDLSDLTKGERHAALVAARDRSLQGLIANVSLTERTLNVRLRLRSRQPSCNEKLAKATGRITHKVTAAIKSFRDTQALPAQRQPEPTLRRHPVGATS